MQGIGILEATFSGVPAKLRFARRLHPDFRELRLCAILFCGVPLVPVERHGQQKLALAWRRGLVASRGDLDG